MHPSLQAQTKAALTSWIKQYKCNPDAIHEVFSQHNIEKLGFTSYAPPKGGKGAKGAKGLKGGKGSPAGHDPQLLTPLAAATLTDSPAPHNTLAIGQAFGLPGSGNTDLLLHYRAALSAGSLSSLRSSLFPCLGYHKVF